MAEHVIALAPVDCSAVWIVTSVCSRTGRWCIHSVHVEEQDARKEVDRCNHTDHAAYSCQHWPVAQPNTELRDAAPPTKGEPASEPPKTVNLAPN